MSVKHDKYKQARVYPEIAKSLEDYRKRNMPLLSFTVMVNHVISNWLKSMDWRVK